MLLKLIMHNIFINELNEDMQVVVRVEDTETRLK